MLVNPVISFLTNLNQNISLWQQLLIAIFFQILPGNYNHDEFAEMHLQPDPLFSIPSDNIYLTCMTGTHLGRIFLGGKDGCVYEIVYQVM